MRVDENTKEVMQTWPLTRVRRWAATANLFTLVRLAILNLAILPLYPASLSENCMLKPLRQMLKSNSISLEELRVIDATFMYLYCRSIGSTPPTCFFLFTKSRSDEGDGFYLIHNVLHSFFRSVLRVRPIIEPVSYLHGCLFMCR